MSDVIEYHVLKMLDNTPEFVRDAIKRKDMASLRLACATGMSVLDYILKTNEKLWEKKK